MRRLLLLPLLLTFAACDSAGSDSTLDGFYVGTANADGLMLTLGIEVATEGGTFTLGSESYAAFGGGDEEARGPITGTGTFDPPSITVNVDEATLLFNEAVEVTLEADTLTGTVSNDGSTITITLPGEDGADDVPLVLRRQ